MCIRDRHSENSKEISIGFYGGEPLRVVPMIREEVDYAEGVFSGKKLLFNMTTNATLLRAFRGGASGTDTADGCVNSSDNPYGKG